MLPSDHVTFLPFAKGTDTRVVFERSVREKELLNGDGGRESIAVLGKLPPVKEKARERLGIFGCFLSFFLFLPKAKALVGENAWGRDDARGKRRKGGRRKKNEIVLLFFFSSSPSFSSFTIPSSDGDELFGKAMESLFFAILPTKAEQLTEDQSVFLQHIAIAVKRGLVSWAAPSLMRTQGSFFHSSSIFLSQEKSKACCCLRQTFNSFPALPLSLSLSFLGKERVVASAPPPPSLLTLS